MCAAYYYYYYSPSFDFKLSQTGNKPPGGGLRASEAEEKRKNSPSWNT
jgi:hypothetical protein